MNKREQTVEQVKAEIAHHISPVIGWIRSDAVHGRDDSDGKRLESYHVRLDLAAEAIVKIFENMEK